MSERSRLSTTHRWVVKIGSALLTNEGQGLDADRTVACIGESGDEIARGLANYSAVEASKIIGQPSHQIKALLGYQRELELINRDNMVLS